MKHFRVLPYLRHWSTSCCSHLTLELNIILHPFDQDTTGSTVEKSVGVPFLLVNRVTTFSWGNSNAISTAKPMLSGSSNPTVIPIILSDQTGSRPTHISTSTYDCNAIPMAIPLFWGQAIQPIILSDRRSSSVLWCITLCIA